ncbi:MAG: toxin-antitoxin system, toxin component, PIN family protein [Deltaproteobacteria bacterium]|nr:MAG: toxin-antitoxin system, toxin component, PIN family protein [Deltaproteobacteria bacterium]
MNVLLDACVWGGARRDLEAVGHDVVWAGEWDEDPGDEAILAHAHRERRVLATLDKDFGALAVAGGQAHSGIVRLVGVRARQQGETLARILTAYAADLTAGAVITVEPGRVRVRLPAGDDD